MNAPLLELKHIGKIYVSESNVTVGIRGVNLTFEKGEFVAVTGMSGSGKSTLLNVISGMDSYEEGEMLVEGEPTSHFLQKDWEEYRKQYISFIFQDYNIIESFTVLQNVELALMNIEDPKARREKALELLRRVGLEKHIHHKGSKLSGGQKQRTVIARALAKDSPIILADEPTGNLDSQSSEEIIELLREVSRDKLLIVVTHNFDQVEAVATRHIRIYDGAVEFDHAATGAKPSKTVNRDIPNDDKKRSAGAYLPPKSAKRPAHTLRNGWHLGWVRFRATPKLSVFLCILMTVTSLAITLISAMSSEASGLFDKRTMFTHMEGRTVIVRSDGKIITDEELERLAADVGAQDFMHYDFMLDESFYTFVGADYEYYRFSFGYPAEDVKLDGGRYPEALDEVILEVPVSLRDDLGAGEDFVPTVLPELFETMADYRVVGVRYFTDNTRNSRILFTEEGYRLASAMAFFRENGQDFRLQLTASAPNGKASVEQYFSGLYSLVIGFDMEPGTYFLNMPYLLGRDNLDQLSQASGTRVDRDNVQVSASLIGSFTSYVQDSYDVYYGGYYDGSGGFADIEVEVLPSYGEVGTITYDFSDKTRVKDVSRETRERLEAVFYDYWVDGVGLPGQEFILISPDILTDFMDEHYYRQAYTQASLFFENDREAHAKVDTLREAGYIAVVSDETVEQDVYDLLSTKLLALMSAIGWVISVVFVSLFLSLCSSRAMNATRGDVAIMRSMGIPTGVVRVSIFVQNLLALLPAILITAGVCVFIYRYPQTNYIFAYLHAGDYAVLGLMLVGIALNLARLHAKRMFSESVKKTLKGGAKQ